MHGRSYICKRPGDFNSALLGSWCGDPEILFLNLSRPIPHQYSIGARRKQRQSSVAVVDTSILPSFGVSPRRLRRPRR